MCDLLRLAFLTGTVPGGPSLEGHPFRHWSQKEGSGTSLVVQWLRLCPPNAGGTGSVPVQGLRFHRLHGVAKTTNSKQKERAAETGKIMAICCLFGCLGTFVCFCTHDSISGGALRIDLLILEHCSRCRTCWKCHNWLQSNQDHAEGEKWWDFILVEPIMLPAAGKMPFVPPRTRWWELGLHSWVETLPWCLEAFYLIPPGTHSNEGIQVDRCN